MGQRFQPKAGLPLAKRLKMKKNILIVILFLFLSNSTYFANASTNHIPDGTYLGTATATLPDGSINNFNTAIIVANKHISLVLATEFDNFIIPSSSTIIGLDFDKSKSNNEIKFTFNKRGLQFKLFQADAEGKQYPLIGRTSLISQPKHNSNPNKLFTKNIEGFCNTNFFTNIGSDNYLITSFRDIGGTVVTIFGRINSHGAIDNIYSNVIQRSPEEITVSVITAVKIDSDKVTFSGTDLEKNLFTKTFLRESCQFQ